MFLTNPYTALRGIFSTDGLCVPVTAGLVSGAGGQVPEGVSCCFPLASPLVTAGAGAVAVLNLPRPALPCSRWQGTRSRLSCLNGSVSSLGAAAIL